MKYFIGMQCTLLNTKMKSYESAQDYIIMLLQTLIMCKQTVQVL